MNQIKAIQTQYKGYNFRSRLEARWAVFFDALGLPWEYEPEGFELSCGKYLPDFRVCYPGRNESERHFEWFECKGDLLQVSQNEWEKMIEFEKINGLTVLDGQPDARMYCSPRLLLGSVYVPENGDLSMPNRPFEIKKYYLEKERDGFSLWSGKGRMWWDYHGNFFDGSHEYAENMINRAVLAARSARFEHGQSGATL